MSTFEQAPDPELIERTKRQIAAIVSEITQLSRSDISIEDFYDALLNRVVAAMAAVGGAVWTLGEQGRLELARQVNLRETGLASNPTGQIQHGLLLRKLLEKGVAASEGMLALPHSGGGEPDSAGNPTDFLLVMGPLRSDQQMQGVLEIFQRPNPQPSMQQGYLRFVLRMCELAGDFLKTRTLRSFVDRQSLWSQLDQFTRIAHSSLDPHVTSFTLANEGRRLIQCDRVSVAIKRGRKCVIESVSGQDVFDKRSNVIVMLQKLASAVAATGEAVWYTGDTENLPPQVEKTIQDYVDESHSKTVAVLPLKRPVAGPDEMGRAQTGEVVGALIVEQIEQAKVDASLVSRVEVVAEHASSALSNSLDYNSIFLMPVWRTIGKAQWMVQARTLPKTVAVVAALLGLTTAAILVPWDFDLHGDGTLQAKDRRSVFAKTEGTVINIAVEDGQQVKKGQTLVQMQNLDLQNQLTKLIGEEAGFLKQIEAYQELRGGAIESYEDIKAASAIAQAEQGLVDVRAQIRLLEMQIDQLHVRSPIDGQVVTSQLLTRLGDRPVQIGEKLLEVADPSGELELEVQMPETRIGHVKRAEVDRLSRIKSGASNAEELQKGLPVNFTLATHPETPLQGYVQEIYPSAEVSEEQTSTVLVRVKIDRDDLPPVKEGAQPQLGGGVSAKIKCGRKSIGYVYLHEVVAFVYRMWFRAF